MEKQTTEEVRRAGASNLAERLQAEQLEQQVIALPGGILALARQALFAVRVEPEDIDGQLAHDAQVGCGLTQMDGAGVLPERDVQAAVQTILDAPVQPVRIQNHSGVRREQSSFTTRRAERSRRETA